MTWRVSTASHGEFLCAKDWIVNGSTGRWHMDEIESDRTHVNSIELAACIHQTLIQNYTWIILNSLTTFPLRTCPAPFSELRSSKENTPRPRSCSFPGRRYRHVDGSWIDTWAICPIWSPKMVAVDGYHWWLAVGSQVGCYCWKMIKGSMMFQHLWQENQPFGYHHLWTSDIPSTMNGKWSSRGFSIRKSTLWGVNHYHFKHQQHLGNIMAAMPFQYQVFSIDLRAGYSSW